MSALKQGQIQRVHGGGVTYPKQSAKCSSIGKNKKLINQTAKLRFTTFFYLFTISNMYAYFRQFLRHPHLYKYFFSPVLSQITIVKNKSLSHIVIGMIKSSYCVKQINVLHTKDIGDIFSIVTNFFQLNYYILFLLSTDFQEYLVFLSMLLSL